MSKNSTRDEPTDKDKAARSRSCCGLSSCGCMTASCYGVQLLSFRQRLAEEEVRKSAARNDELKAAGRLAAEIAHQLKNPLGIINNAVFSPATRPEGRQKRFQPANRNHPRGNRAFRPHPHPVDGLRAIERGPGRKVESGARNWTAPSPKFCRPGTNYDIEIHRDYGANLPAVLMQRSHLSVVLVNLLQNAREALQRPWQHLRPGPLPERKLRGSHRG